MPDDAQLCLTCTVRCAQIMAMKLSDYRAAEKLTVVEMGRRLGVSHSTVSRLESWKVAPGHDLVLTIVRVTGGKVTPNDLFRVGDEVGAA